MVSRRLGFFVLIQLSLTTVPSVAAPAGDNQRAAQVHAQAGMDYYLAGQYARAIAELEEAYSLVPSPIILFNIAQAHRRNGDAEKAVVYYKRYLDKEPNPPDRDKVEQRIRELDVRKATAKEEPPSPSRYSPPPPPDPPPRIQLSPPASLKSETFEAEAVRQDRVRLFLAAGMAHPLLRGTRELETANLFAGGVGASYLVGDLTTPHFELGGSASWSPLSYAKNGSDEEVRSNLVGLFANVTLRLPVSQSVSMGPSVGAGLVWWTGLGTGNPFAEGKDTGGAVPMPTGRVSLSATWTLQSHAFIGLDLGVSFSKTTGDALPPVIASVLRMEANACVGLIF